MYLNKELQETIKIIVRLRSMEVRNIYLDAELSWLSVCELAMLLERPDAKVSQPVLSSLLTIQQIIQRENLADLLSNT